MVSVSECRAFVRLWKVMSCLSAFLIAVFTVLNINTHTQPFYGLFSGTTQVSRCQRRNLLLDFMAQRKITEADTPIIQLGATPSRLIISDPPPSYPTQPDGLCVCPPVATRPIYPGLKQAPNMLACIPSGLVVFNSK